MITYLAVRIEAFDRCKVESMG